MPYLRYASVLLRPRRLQCEALGVSFRLSQIPALSFRRRFLPRSWAGVVVDAGAAVAS